MIKTTLHKTPFIIASLTIAALFLLASCHEKGCTNPLALNYNATADQDDGSCIVCKTTQSQIDTVSLYLTDTYYSSPHYNQRVARFFLNQQAQYFSDNLCGKAKATITLSVQSLVNQNMYFQYNVRSFSGPLNIYDNRTILIAPNQTIDEGIIETFNNPPFISMAFDSLYVTVYSQQITYY